MNDMKPFHNQLLTTKFFLPVSSHATIERARLFALLDEGLSRPLTLVTAPAGFGKSTLVSKWVQSRSPNELSVSWISLDEDDNEQKLFWEYVLTALERRQSGTYQSLLTALHEQQISLHDLLTALLNALEERETPQLLVLDDYHTITERALHSMLATFIERLPPQMHVLLITRSAPPIRLSRLRGRDQVLEIRTDHLRWTLEESQAFLQTAMKLELEPHEVEQVAHRTEGWVMGPQLLALSLRGYATPQSLLTQLSGKERYILDYLTEEVLQQQPTKIQDFLLHTSILARLSAPLCDAVAGQTNSQQTLEMLEQANVFLVPLDGERRWYRYHALFAEALRTRLEQGADRRSFQDLHRHASDWYAEHGYLKEAVEHALRTRDWPWTLDLMELAIQTLPKGRQGSPSLLPWLSQVPAQAIRQRPRLCLFFARVLLLSARFREACSWLDAAEASMGITPSPEEREQEAAALEQQRALLGELWGYRAQIAGYTGDSQTVYALCQQARSYLGKQDVYEQANIVCALTQAAMAEGQISTALQQALTASRLLRAANVTQAAICYHSIVASLQQRQGQLQAAWHTCQEAIALGTETEHVPFTAVGLAYTYQADLLREWNRLDEALDFAMRGIHLAEQGGYTIVYIGRAYQVLIRVYLSRREVDAAQGALQELRQLPLLAQNPYQQAVLTSVEQVRCWIASGAEGQAPQRASKLAHQERSHLPPAATGREEIAQIRVHLLQEQASEALSHLEPLIAQATAQQHWEQVLEARLLQSQVNKQTAEALSTLAEAVHLAEPEGFIRAFVDEGAAMEPLLSMLGAQERKQGPTPYLGTLLAAFHAGTAQQPSAHPSTAPLLDPLSAREQEVLHLLAQGESNQEIASALVVAADTVKYHVSNILLKLQVRNRTQAVVRARSLGLLPEEA